MHCETIAPIVCQGYVTICSACRVQSTSIPYVREIVDNKLRLRTVSPDRQMERLAQQIKKENKDGFYILSFDGKEYTVLRQDKKEAHRCNKKKNWTRLFLSQAIDYFSFCGSFQKNSAVSSKTKKD